MKNKSVMEHESTRSDILRACLWEYSKIKYHEEKLRSKLTVRHSMFLMWSKNRLEILKKQYRKLLMTG